MQRTHITRDNPDSENKLWIKGNTEIGPVLEVKTTFHLDVYGIEILITSTSRNNTNSGVVISRGPNRYVDELRYTDPDYSPESLEETDYGSIEGTHAQQPTTQSRSQCSQSEDHIPFHKREWIDITAIEYSLKIPHGNPYLEICHEIGTPFGFSRKRI